MFCGDVVVSDGTGGLISMVWNSFFQGPVGFTYVFSCTVMGWAFPVVDYISFLCIWNWIFWIQNKDLMVLVPLKKTLTLCFARVCLYCLMRPLIYGMTTLAPSINFTVHGFGFLLVFCWDLLCWKNYAGQWLSYWTLWGWPISFTRNPGKEHT